MTRWTLLALITACGDPTLTSSEVPATGATPTGGGGGSGTGTGTGTGSTTGAGAAEAVCARWNADRADMSEGSWSGSTASCDAGTLSADAHDNALRMVNLYRWLVGLPEVRTDPSKDNDAQACSLMMQAAGTLSHTPDASWPCYTPEGANGAGTSNIASAPAVAAIDLYMADPGNETTIGHRRWILSNWIDPIGVGGASSYSCLVVIGGNGSGDAPWTAWPPPGVTPLQAMYASWSTVDDAGWTLQSDTLNLDGAVVTVTRNGQDLPVITESLLPYYGSNAAIRFVPQGWSSEAGTYHVDVAGASEPIAYDVELVDCGP